MDVEVATQSQSLSFGMQGKGGIDYEQNSCRINFGISGSRDVILSFQPLERDEVKLDHLTAAILVAG